MKKNKKKKSKITKKKKKKKIIYKSRKKISFKKRKKSIKTNKKKNKITIKKKDFIFSVVKLQQKLKFKFNFSFDLFSIDRAIQNFFGKIDESIQKYRILKRQEEDRLKIRELERLEKLKVIEEKRRKEEIEKNYKIKLKELKEEELLEKQRKKEIKTFLRKEQAIIRKEQAEKQRKFLEEIKLEQKIDKFRVREVKELERLERISLKEKREDYAGLQERIEKLKQKYKLIRDQKIRERVEALGVKVQEGDDRETLLIKEREYHLARQKVELALESFYRSANSLVFQLNKRHITRHMSILRCIDRRFESGEIFIKWDESIDDDWLILIYIKNNSPEEGIVIEDKSNPEKNLSHEFKSSDIFKASDLMVDSLTNLISKKREKK